MKLSDGEERRYRFGFLWKWGRANVILPHAVTSIWPRIVWSSFRDAHIHVEENLEVMARNCFVWRPRCKHLEPDCTGGHGSKWEHFEAGTSQALTYLPALSGDRIMWLTQTLRTVWAIHKGSPTQRARAFPLPLPPALYSTDAVQSYTQRC